jgi:hypothetical protein
MSERYHIHTTPSPAPFSYPAAFRLMEHDDYVKYGHPVFEGRAARGDPHWTAEIITQTWYQAETGRIPISGAGYGGPFAGARFDGIWLDMSEIVRPTRDGIHGRETISTAVDLGRRLPALDAPGGRGDLAPGARLNRAVSLFPLAIVFMYARIIWPVPKSQVLARLTSAGLREKNNPRKSNSHRQHLRERVVRHI